MLVKVHTICNSLDIQCVTSFSEISLEIYILNPKEATLIIIYNFISVISYFEF